MNLTSISVCGIMISDDITIIRDSLRKWRNVAHSLRRGGLQTEWEEAKRALEALDRVEQVVKGGK